MDTTWNGRWFVLQRESQKLEQKHFLIESTKFVPLRLAYCGQWTVSLSQMQRQNAVAAYWAFCIRCRIPGGFNNGQCRGKNGCQYRKKNRKKGFGSFLEIRGSCWLICGKPSCDVSKLANDILKSFLLWVLWKYEKRESKVKRLSNLNHWCSVESLFVL